MPSSCILFSNSDKSIVLIDIPRSIELAQVLPDQTCSHRLISCKPLESPWQSQVSHKSQESNVSQPASALIDELMTCENCRNAHQVILDANVPAWLLPRTYNGGDDQGFKTSSTAQKRKLPSMEQGNEEPQPMIPPGSHHLLGSIASQRDVFLTTAPKFDLIILDPPWPSRSVRRKKDRYSTAYNMQEIHQLLSLIPIAGHLKPDGVVAVWITNKPAINELLKSSGGILEQWGVEIIGEWVWVKTTNRGQPVVDFDSTWRKPWERLLIARRRGGAIKLQPQNRVLFGVPDLHSRKPNLKFLFDEILPKGYVGLEIFSRNLTAGWWGWGDQTLMFQQKHHWLEYLAEEEARDEQLSVLKPSPSG